MSRNIINLIFLTIYSNLDLTDVKGNLVFINVNGLKFLREHWRIIIYVKHGKGQQAGCNQRPRSRVLRVYDVSKILIQEIPFRDKSFSPSQFISHCLTLLLS